MTRNASWTCPVEFDQILSARARQSLSRDRPERKAGPFRVWSQLIDRKVADQCVRALDRNVYQHLQLIENGLPDDWKRRTKATYGERLEKIIRARSAFLQRCDSHAYRAVERLGLLAMLKSKSLMTFAERMTGRRLVENGHQILCYETGDYVGPHTDYFPELKHLKNGYVDVHIMLSNPGVQHQWLVYEHEGHLSRIENIARNGTIAVYELPFWHYTTPMVSRRGCGTTARRWVLMTTFAYRKNGAH